jgi:ABC-type glycerol-3-phosphate transport system substrate-binding protein
VQVSTGRREVLGAGLALGATHAWLAHAQSPVTLTLSVWGAQAEQDAFNALINRYQSLHPNVTIRLEVNGNSMQLYQLVDTRLAGGRHLTCSGFSTSRSAAMRALTPSLI